MKEPPTQTINALLHIVIDVAINIYNTRSYTHGQKDVAINIYIKRNNT